LKELEKRIENLEREQPTSLPQSTQDILLLLKALDDKPLSELEEQRISEMAVEDMKVWEAWQEGRLEKISVPGCGYRLIIHDKPIIAQDGGENVE